MKGKIIYTLIVIVSVTIWNNAQAQIVGDVTGKNWKQKTIYSEVSGSPFLSENWSKGTVKFSDNTVSNVIELKFDQIEDILLFKNDKQETLEFAEPIKEFQIAVSKGSTLEQKTFRAGFNLVQNNTNKSYYEILSDGKIKFVKRTIKTIMEENAYNSPTTTKKIIEKPYYFLVINNTPMLINKNEKTIIGALPDKNEEMAAYVKANKLNLKDDGDISKLLTHYNELTK